jgi:hypothetical protein
MLPLRLRCDRIAPDSCARMAACTAVEIAANVETVRSRIHRAAAHAGRDSCSIKLVAVCKTVPADRVFEAWRSGIADFGENYVQEADEKISAVNQLIAQSGAASGHAQPYWHFVGHLQTNKVKACLSLFNMLQCLDRLVLAQELHRRACQVGARVPVLVQVNTSGEPSKHGLGPDELLPFLEKASTLEAIQVLGLMTIGKLTSDPEEARPDFRLLASLAEKARSAQIPGVQMRWLSMGMSADFEAAIEEGANMLRIGTAIFGPRH